LKDRASYTALDFAAPQTRNAEERSTRARGVYKEDVYNDDKQRREITRMLGSQPTKLSDTHSLPSSGDPDYNFHSFHKSPATSSIIFTAPIAEFIVPRQSKTIARLERGHPFPPVCAMSGWGHDNEELATINGLIWTEEVFRICRLIGYELPPDSQYDKGRDGNYNACHAEKQLVAYFLSKHVFLADETAVEEEVDLWDYEGNWRRKTNLRDLFLARPPASLQRATILVSTKICPSCIRFIEKVEEFFRLSFCCRFC
jgi:hypothetical protein